MAVISGILKDPIGGPRVGVVIELRAVRTSATVVNQARSQSITDATGKYTLTVEPGAYDVMITAGGRQPERVGGITVALNSQNGTLNDFLTTPGESDLTPEIVAIVDRMRAEAANSAAAALASENNAAAAMVNALSKTVTTEQAVAGAVTFSKSPTFSSGFTTLSEVTLQGKTAGANVIQRFKDMDGVEQGAIYSTSSTGQLTFRWGGTSYSALLKPDGSVTFPSTVYSGVTALIKAGEFGIGGITPLLSTTNTLDVIKNLKTGCYAVSAGSLDMPISTASWQLDWRLTSISNGLPYGGVVVARSLTAAGNPSNKVYRNTLYTGVWQGWIQSWDSANTTVDANGFLKKASPIVKLFGDGTSELNDQSQGVITERISEGVYRVSGVMGFNSDPAWGGPNGGIGLPRDNNDLTLLWVDYEVDETGDLLIKTFHRINSTAPKFAQNIVAGYKEGQPIDIPPGRWIDLRVEMPAGDEPEVILEPDTDQQLEAETEQQTQTEPENGTEPGQGDAPETETKE